MWVKWENSSLPVAVRVSKTRVLEIPVMRTTEDGKQNVPKCEDDNDSYNNATKQYVK